ncbi:MAG: UDP-3-O-(3-hydroxymyristoyl)glucosamine N-acyltransferase [Hahellaceae bacterium]|nr:UDP-3-O-(3-hydroxymyristoyl)glucosamine N-acyltransferase [Hahellaceae bacterium]
MKVVKRFSLGELATRIGATLEGDPDVVIEGLSTIDEAGPAQLAFLANPAYAKFLPTTRASAVILHPSMKAQCPVSALLMPNPYAGYALVTQLFAVRLEGDRGIHPSAVVHPSAQLGKNVTVGANVVIEAGASIGAGSYLGPGCYVGGHTILGEAAYLYPNVTLYEGVSIGARVILHAGSVIGADGFGFAPDKGRFIKIAQLGGVVLGDDVEVGANTTIDRGALGDTVIEDGVKLDNQIQIAHNVHIGAHTVIAACAGISGSSRVGKHCMIGGGVGIAGHLTLCDGVHLTGMTLVTHDIKEPGVYSSGTAIEPNKSWRRNVARFRQLDQWVQRIRELELKGAQELKKE